MSIPALPNGLSPRRDRPATPSVFNVQRLREDFPILSQKVRGKPLVYLDNAATTQKPRAVLDALHALLQRGQRQRSSRPSTCSANGPRRTTRPRASRCRASSARPTRARSSSSAAPPRGSIWWRRRYGRKKSAPATRCSSRRWSTTRTSSPGKCCARRRGPSCASSRSTTPASCCWTSSRNCSRRGRGSWPSPTSPMRWARSTRSGDIMEMAHARGVPVLVDGAQSAPHLPIDVRELGCDFFVFSGHKLYGPTGIGVLYGREALLEAMPPWQGGGDMIRSVTFEKTTYNEPAVQVRGGHAGHRRRRRPRGGDRLPPGPGRGGRRRLRIHAAAIRHEPDE